jgi:dihydroorotate dehydrogenase (NAD+) catalytic subunit
MTGVSRPSRRVADVDLSVEVAGMVLPNPVMTASGCAAAGRELGQFFDVRELGAVVTKSIFPEARSGRATPRMAETPSGMLNSIGLQGPGVASFVANDLEWLLSAGARPVVSIAGETVSDYVDVARVLRGVDGIAGFEVNISCPNVENRGMVFACDPAASASVISAVRRELPGGIPILAKLTPDVTDIVSVAAACMDAGADGLSLINTLLGLVIDTSTLRPALAGITGGLSGPAMRPVALRCVYQVHAAMPSVPIVGIGGIRSGDDALQFLAAGASAVQVGTATFGDPHAPVRVRDELAEELARRGFSSVRDVVGLAHRPAE